MLTTQYYHVKIHCSLIVKGVNMSSYDENETERLLKIIKDKTGRDLSYRNDTV